MRAAWLVLALTLIWPVGHIAATRWSDLSPWRLGGWGMYSIPHESNVTVHIYLLDAPSPVNGPAARRARNETDPARLWLDGFMREATLDTGLAIFTAGPPTIEEVRLGPWSTLFGRDVRDLVRSVQALGGAGPVSRLLHRLGEIEPAVARSKASIVVLGRPRLSLLRGWTCVEKTVYRYQDGAVVRVGHFLDEPDWLDRVR
jgi:hypothetical protein